MRLFFLLTGALLLTACGLGFNPDLPSAQRGGAEEPMVTESPGIDVGIETPLHEGEADAGGGMDLPAAGGAECDGAVGGAGGELALPRECEGQHQ